MLSSDLVREATVTTYAEWVARYRALPVEPLTTEIDVEATARRRSRRHEPGHCYLVAGWTFAREIPAGHGRPRKHILQAPPASAETGDDPPLTDREAP